ncbi:hypothetical protein GGS21DRAFT_493675 [Xylaria nigripes]|nr:hypothetical protein GGS21DRAFT_493675 [Xylaria nigripes]
MYWISALIAVTSAIFPSWTNSQELAGEPNQINVTMCAWYDLRAAQLKDTLYMDGGFLYMEPGLASGEYGPTISNDPSGFVYTLNFSRPFNSSTNTSSILEKLPLGLDGKDINKSAPNYIDGAMLANDNEFFLYGGLSWQGEAAPEADAVLSYQASGFHEVKLPGNLTRYVTYGAAVNAPSENKAWYFGGYRSPTWGPIFQTGGDDSDNPTNVSNTLITLDIGVNTQKWNNATLPPNIPSRANPSAVWLPVGKQGVLVILGGVSYPEYVVPEEESQNEAQSENDSPGYMANIDIYDVASDKWYQQPTSHAPPPLAMGCAVAASAEDLSSYNIYYYGGFDGLHDEFDFNDDVWVLSLPSFIWTKLSSGTPGHARRGHQCVKPYPDQMVTIGGRRSPKGGEGIPCLEGGILQVFNLTEGTWLDSYDPDIWNTYGVPEMIHTAIGGDFRGKATLTTPVPSGWATPELASVFSATYPASKITTYFPYGSQGPGKGKRDPGENGNAGNRSWLAPVLGVVLGLVFVTIIVVGIVLYRRRKLWRKTGGGENQVDDSNHHIRNWLNGTREKAPTMTTDNPSSYLEDTESRNETPMHIRYYTDQVSIPDMARHEMPENQQRFELMDTSNLAELSSGGTPNEHTSNTSQSVPTTQSPNPAPREQLDSVGSLQAIDSTTNAPLLSQERPKLSTLQNASPSRKAPQNRHAVSSDVSGISEREVSHLRNLSGQTVSSTSNTIPSRLSPTPPPMDYSENNVQTGSSRPLKPRNSLRASMFHENVGDMSDEPTRSR